MSEKEQPVKTVKMEYYCDDCDIATEYSGVMLMVDPPWYVYVCPKCEKQYYLQVHQKSILLSNILQIYEKD